MLVLTCLYKVLSLPPSSSWNVCAAFCFLFPSNFARGEELEKSGSIRCMKSYLSCVLVWKKGQEQSSLGWPTRFPRSCYHLPDASATLLLAPDLCHLSLLLCPMCVPAISIPGTHMYPWFLSFSSSCFPLLPSSLSSNFCLSVTHSSCKNSDLINILSSHPTGYKNPSDFYSTLHVSPCVFACHKGVMDLSIYALFGFIKSERTGISSLTIPYA